MSKYSNSTSLQPLQAFNSIPAVSNSGCYDSTRNRREEGGGEASQTQLVTNTKLATASGYEVPKQSKTDRKKKLILQSIAKDVLGANKKPSFVDFDLPATHVKTGKGRNAVYTLAPDGKRGLYYEVQTFEGLRYVKRALTRGRHKVQMFVRIDNPDHYQNESIYQGADDLYYRKAHEGENGRYYRLMPDFYRLGACCQVSSIFRPNSISGEFNRQEMKDVKEAVSVASIAVREVSGSVEAKIKGLMQCENRWVCPCCSSYLANYDNQRVRSALYQHYNQGGYVLFLTWTLSHNVNSECSVLVEALKAAVKSVKSGGTWTRFRKKYGYIGSFSSTEYTHTMDNGHHPHLHELMFLSEDFNPMELKKLKFEMSKRYRAFLQKSGQFANAKRGLDIRLALASNVDKQVVSDATGSVDINDIESLTDYMTKGLDCAGSHDDVINDQTKWTVAEEVTKGHLKGCKVKRNKKGDAIVSFTATGLLEQIHHLSGLIKKTADPDQKAFLIAESRRFRAIYSQYARAFQGVSMMRFSPGMADRFNLPEMVPKKVLQEVENAFEDDVIELTVTDLRTISTHRLRASIIDFVEVCMQGDAPLSSRIANAKGDIRRFLDYYRSRPVETFSYG